MAWSWRYETAEGTALEGEALSDEPFPSRGDAESWLGENWRELKEAGAEKVSLLEDATSVYTMSLAED